MATVSKKGVIRAVSAGTTKITVTAADGSGKKASCTVRVSESTESTVPVASIRLNKTQLNLKQGGEERLTATVNPSNATDKTIRWASSNQAVARVSDNGTVRAVAEGTATITASAHNNVRAVCNITVEASPVQPEEPVEPGEGKILVAYFSWSGTSERIANNIIEQTGADSFRIERETPYSDDYNEVAYGEAKDEADNNARPPIKNPLASVGQYDRIVLCYPIWHGQAPRIISTFLESYDLSGKTIVPFCTSHSSGIGSSAANLHALCPDSVKWTDGRRFAAGTPKDEIGNWLAGEGILTPDLEACSHSYGSQVTKQPTCTVTGEIIYTCIHCGRSYTEKTAAMGHKPVLVPAVPADCEKQGKTEGSYCEVCRQEITAQRVVPAAGHEFTNVITKAGKLKDGFITERCTVCGKEGDRKTIAAVKTIRLSRTSYTYNGKKCKPSVIVTDRNEKRLKEGTDYTVSYPSGSKNAGIYTIKVQFRGNYSGIEKTSFQITPKGTVIVRVSAREKGFTVKWKKQRKQTDGAVALNN